MADTYPSCPERFGSGRLTWTLTRASRRRVRPAYWRSSRVRDSRCTMSAAGPQVSFPPDAKRKLKFSDLNSVTPHTTLCGGASNSIRKRTPNSVHFEEQESRTHPTVEILKAGTRHLVAAARLQVDVGEAGRGERPGAAQRRQRPEGPAARHRPARHRQRAQRQAEIHVNISVEKALLCSAAHIICWSLSEICKSANACLFSFVFRGWNQCKNTIVGSV